MAFNNQAYHYQTHGAIPSVERQESGYVEGKYVRMMDVVAPAIVDGHDAVLSTPQVGHEGRPYSTGVSNYQGGTSYNDPYFRGYHRASVQQDSRLNHPRARSHSGGGLRSQGSVRFDLYNGHQQYPPPNAFSCIGDICPNPPPAWQNGSDAPSRVTHQGTRPSAFSDYGVAYPAPSFAGFNSSPYAADAPNLDSYPWPREKPRPIGRRVETVQGQPGPRQIRGPTVPIVNREVEDEENSSEREEDRKAGKEQQSIMAKGKKKSKKASKAKKEVRKGLTRLNANGELEWLATASSEGVLAVTHDDIRPQLIAIAEAERIALGVQNDHPDEPGPGKYNVTSFYRKHIHWGPDREHRPEINFDWEEDRERNPRPTCLGYMYWEENGKKYVVLDPHDNPVRDWDIPATIASNVPGYKLEAMRRENMSLGHKDFWARMPRQINFGTEDQPIWEKLGDPNSTVNMPMERFRFHTGLCSWTDRTKTRTIKEGLEKLYGNKIQNNTVRAFGRDLTTREIKEIKKGDKAVFPIIGDVVPAARRTLKNKSKRAAKPTEPVANAKAQSGKRKYATDDEEASSEEEAQTQVRSHKRARRGGKEDRIAAEVDDLVMFEQAPTILDEADATKRYSLRSTRQDAKAPKRIETIEESSSESSADEEYEDVPNQRYSPRKPHGSSNRVDESSYESSAETDGEDTPAPRVPFRRIPGVGDVGGKSKGPSWVSSTKGNDQNDEEQDHRHTVMLLRIDGRVHYATYEGLISNGPVHSIGGSDVLPQGQAREVNGASPAQTGSCTPQPHAFDVMMKMPLIEEKDFEEEDMPLQTHRKRVRDFLGDEEVEAYTPSSKRLRTEQPVLPIPASATHGAHSSFPPPQIVPQTIVPQPTVPPQMEQPNRSPLAPHASPSQTRNQKLDAEWAQVFEPTFIDLGFQSVNYSEVPPWNDEEVQSLIDALLPTREVYSAWTGEPAPRTDPHRSYRAQFDTIFGAFHDWWRAHRPNEALPILAGVMHWGKSVDDWESPSKDSIYFEAFRKGHRAPPDDWPGPRLEDAFRKGW